MKDTTKYKIAQKLQEMKDETGVALQYIIDKKLANGVIICNKATAANILNVIKEAKENLQTPLKAEDIESIEIGDILENIEHGYEVLILAVSSHTLVGVPEAHPKAPVMQEITKENIGDYIKI